MIPALSLLAPALCVLILAGCLTLLAALAHTDKALWADAKEVR